MTNLTERERSVMTYLIKGYKNGEIADKLSISVHTVKAHLESIYDKLGVNNRVQAAIKAANTGQIKISDIG